MWRELLGGLIGPVTEWVRQRGERARIREEGQTQIAQAEIAADVARANHDATLAQTGVEAERDWDIEAARQAQRSWKDELWTLVFALPIVVAFVPGGAGLVMVGFQAISIAPGWYQAGVAASIAFSFGIRHIVQVMQERWGRRS